VFSNGPFHLANPRHRYVGAVPAVRIQVDVMDVVQALYFVGVHPSTSRQSLTRNDRFVHQIERKNARPIRKSF